MEFVDEAIAKLLARGSMGGVLNTPRCVNPLDAVSRRVWKRLIFCLQLVNEYLLEDAIRFKLEVVEGLLHVLHKGDLQSRS